VDRFEEPEGTEPPGELHGGGGAWNGGEDLEWGDRGREWQVKVSIKRMYLHTLLIHQEETHFGIYEETPSLK